MARTHSPFLNPLWLLVAVVALAAGVGSALGVSGVFIVLAGMALLGAIWIFWQSLQSLTGDAPLTIEEAMGLGAPSVEEERKTAVLRALKDLEFERGVGKISEADYQQLSSKYRAEAKALLMLLDSHLSSSRKRAEELLAERLERGAPGAAETETEATVASTNEDNK